MIAKRFILSLIMLLPITSVFADINLNGAAMMSKKLNFVGNVNAENSTFQGVLYLENGSLNATSSSFYSDIYVMDGIVTAYSSTFKSITITMPTTSPKAPRVTLEKSKVEGDITFREKAGEVIILDGEFKGQVINGSIIQQ